jgi:hypothetical protein
VVKKPDYFDVKSAAFNEMPLFCSVIRRVELRGDLVKVYDAPWRRVKEVQAG